MCFVLTSVIHFWNVAGDYVTNLVVIDAGMILPMHFLMKSIDMTEDEIYTTLQQNGGAGVSGLSEFDGTCVQPNPSAVAQSNDEAEGKAAVQQAAESAKAQGKLPGSLSSLSMTLCHQVYRFKVCK